MSVLTVTFKKLLSLILAIFSVLRTLYRRLVCRSRSSRRMSGSILPLTTEHIQPQVQQSLPSNQVELQAWDLWNTDTNPGDKPQLANGPQNKIYHSQTIQENEETEPEPDYFQDMKPQFRRPAKVVIKRKEEEKSTFSSRLGVSTDVPQQGGELGAWEDTAENTWGEETMEDLSWQAESALKETRRLEREQRQLQQQQRKQEREVQRTVRNKDTNFSAVRLS